MSKKNYYEILGTNQDATEKQIGRAYARITKKLDEKEMRKKAKNSLQLFLS